MIENGKKVKFNYSLKVDGEIIDKTKDAPFEYVHGKDPIIPGLQEELEGMKKGEEKNITLPPEKACGNEDPEALKEVPRDRLPPDTKPELGMTVEFATSDGKTVKGTIKGVRDDTVVVNFNHPLAGKTLVFDVEIIEVQ